MYTLRRVFCDLNPMELEASLKCWGQELVHLLVGPRWWGTRWLSTASSCAAPAGQAQTQVAQKHNELVAIPQVLDLVEVRGSVVRIDAIGCQRAVAATLVTQVTC